MATLLDTVRKINLYLSDYILVFLLGGSGLFFTFKTGFVQFRCLPKGLKKVFGALGKKDNKSSPCATSSFQALTTAVAAQVGTGNIVGACGAILLGGPGAIFWMWVISLFSMATIYAEAVLAQKTRIIQSDGTIAGGPVYYIKSAFSGTAGKVISGFFSLATILALGFMGSMVQSNSISTACSTAFKVPPWLIGMIIAASAGLIFLGGVDRLTRVTEKLVPLMAIVYILGGLVILFVKKEFLPSAFVMIFKYALRPDAVIGGSLGMALKTTVSQGVKRGLFSNEAGMGSTPHAHALADVKSPHEQGVTAMVGVFIDTFLVLSITGLVVVSVLYADGNKANLMGVNKNNMAQIAFSSVFGDKLGEGFVAISLFFFAFSSIISWNYFGKVNAQYLFGKKFLPIYTIASVIFIFLGSCLSNDLVWEMADLFNQLMVIPNVISLIALSGTVAHYAKDKDKN